MKDANPNPAAVDHAHTCASDAKTHELNVSKWQNCTFPERDLLEKLSNNNLNCKKDSFQSCIKIPTQLVKRFCFSFVKRHRSEVLSIMQPQRLAVARVAYFQNPVLDTLGVA